MNRNLILPVITLGIVGATLIGINSTLAQCPADPSSLVQKLAKKFNLKEADIQQVFNEDITEHKTQMHQRIEERLTQAVKDGELTEAQKQAIIAKQQELEKEFVAHKDNFKDMAPEQRRAEMEKRHSELEAWAKANGLEGKFMMFLGDHNGHKGGPDFQVGFKIGGHGALHHGLIKEMKDQ
jgi:hypothetical protein